MAFHIRITKISEDDEFARYGFNGGGQLGTLVVMKTTGEITLVEAAPDDALGHYFRRAASRLRRHWSDGVLPGLTEWAPPGST
jgi:hypothetical protein